jgi:hypothetical protein
LTGDPTTSAAWALAAILAFLRDGASAVWWTSFMAGFRSRVDGMAMAA